MRLVIPALILACVASLAVAQQPQPLIRARIEPVQNIVVGQPVHLVVEVLVPNYFTGSPDFPEFEIKDAIVVLSRETPQNFSERIGNDSYAGIRRTYTLYPERRGQFQLPPAKVTVPYTDVPPHATEAQLSMPALSFSANIPAAARDLSYFLPTTKLDVQQKWSPSLKNLHVGDTIERTVSVTSENLQGMFIPPLPFEIPDGLRLYPEEPKVEDQTTDRGEFIGGRRIQSAKYLVQKEGEYTLPAIDLEWWNLRTGQLRTTTLPVVHFHAAANPESSADLPPPAEPVVPAQTRPASSWARKIFWLRAVAPWAAIVLLMSWLAWRYVPRAHRWIGKKREQFRDSETAYFRELLRNCYGNKPNESYRWLLGWLSRAHPGVTLEEFLQLNKDASLRKEVEELGAALYGAVQPSEWSGQELAESLKKYRRSTDTQNRRQPLLPSLNPNRSATS